MQETIWKFNSSKNGKKKKFTIYFIQSWKIIKYFNILKIVATFGGDVSVDFLIVLNSTQ